MEETKTQPINPADVVSTPNAGAKPQQGNDSTDLCDAISRKRPLATRPEDAKERDVKKLRDTKRKQFGSNGYACSN